MTQTPTTTDKPRYLTAERLERLLKPKVQPSADHRTARFQKRLKPSGAPPDNPARTT